VNGGTADEILIMDSKSKKTHVFKASNALDAQEWISAMKGVVGGGSRVLEKSATAPAAVKREDSVQTFESGESTKSETVAVGKEDEKDIEKKKAGSKFGSMFRRKKTVKVVEVGEVA
jgi:hypothetical protein